MGLDTDTWLWGSEQVLRVGHLVAGVGGYKRASDILDPGFRSLRPVPPSEAMQFKRRMVECAGGEWEDSLRPDVEVL